mgnify:CR=1 FL=1
MKMQTDYTEDIKRLKASLESETSYAVRVAIKRLLSATRSLQNYHEFGRGDFSEISHRWHCRKNHMLFQMDNAMRND